MYAAQVASGQGQCGLGADGHVVNRAATYLPITGPSLEDWTRICNIHSQQANKVRQRERRRERVHACVLSCVEKALHPHCFWPPGWDNLEFLQAVWVDMAWQTPLNCPPLSHLRLVLIRTNILCVCHFIQQWCWLQSLHYCQKLLSELLDEGHIKSLRCEKYSYELLPVCEGFMCSANAENTKHTKLEPKQRHYTKLCSHVELKSDGALFFPSLTSPISLAWPW